MRTAGNTVLITGGGSGIGKGLAEAFHRKGNRVIVAGRRKAALQAVAKANPGMGTLVLDIGDKAGIEAFAAEAVRAYPALNVVIHNAGIMKVEKLPSLPDGLDIAEDVVTTNLLGPIRLTAALLPHLLKQPQAAILTVSSGLAFVPMATTPTYCATKAAIHSYSMSLRQQLKDTGIAVIEIAPPYVQTGLLGEHQASDPRAMPLDAFIAEVMELLARPNATEIIVERCKPLRFAAENNKVAEMFETMSAMTH